MTDYIERRRALGILHEIGGCGAEPGTWADGYDKAINEAYDRISREPAADVAPVGHGKWLNAGDWALAECSECGEVYDVSDNPCEEHFKLFGQFYRYCPNCGAKMDGKDTNVPTAMDKEKTR